MLIGNALNVIEIERDQWQYCNKLLVAVHVYSGKIRNGRSGFFLHERDVIDGQAPGSASVPWRVNHCTYATFCFDKRIFSGIYQQRRNFFVALLGELWRLWSTGLFEVFFVFANRYLVVFSVSVCLHNWLRFNFCVAVLHVSVFIASCVHDACSFPWIVYSCKNYLCIYIAIVLLLLPALEVLAASLWRHQCHLRIFIPNYSRFYSLTTSRQTRPSWQCTFSGPESVENIGNFPSFLEDFACAAITGSRSRILTTHEAAMTAIDFQWTLMTISSIPCHYTDTFLIAITYSFLLL